ncbi:MAG: YciI family protein [Nocardioides sp.]
MKYVMFVVHDPDHTDADVAAAPDIEDWFAEMRERGTYLSGTRLHERETATTVRVRGGETIVSDGPFTESKEWVAGFAVLDCADLDEAIEVASKNPAAYYGRVEVRPIHSSTDWE